MQPNNIISKNKCQNASLPIIYFNLVSDAEVNFLKESGKMMDRVLHLVNKWKVASVAQPLAFLEENSLD